MDDEATTLGGQQVMLCAADGPRLDSEAAALDLIGSLWGQEIDWIVLPKARLGEGFLNLRTGLAGSIIQKFVTYRLGLAIVGDISAELAASGALGDFVRESNSGGRVWFVPHLPELESRLSAWVMRSSASPPHYPTEAEGGPSMPTVDAIVSIVAFRPDHAAAWAALNQAWIAEGGFAVEDKDRQVIDDPQGAILDHGGRIFMVERDGEVIGCCALMAMNDGGYEVAKMTVSPGARGLGLGRRLLEACEAAARAAGAPRLYLETSSTLKPAGALYRSFGFVDLPPRPSPYVRADVWMEKRL